MALYRTDLVKVNPYTRPALKLLDVKGIIMHYTANPGATAEGHQRYFNGTAISSKRYASAHIFIDKKEAVLIVPLNEVAYHANEKPSKIDKFKATAPYYKGGNANLTTIGIELCIEKDGSLHPDTYKRAVDVVAALVKQFKLKETDIYRHYDITGKNCPAFWVKNPSGFTKFKADVKAKITPKPAPKPVTTASAKAETHKVVSGDTLWGISRKYGVSVAEIKSINGLKSDVLQIGQVLRLTRAVYHTVVKGDTLWELSIKYKTTVDNIKKLNNLKSDLLSIGQKLRVK